MQVGTRDWSLEVYTLFVYRYLVGVHEGQTVA
jgi:hypothetical protein